MPSLFDPIQLGAIHAPNRMLMAPLTRGRATRAHVPTPIMAEYYAQRASAGLILSEATGISRQGLGWAYAPGLWNEAQTDAWKPVVEAVHQAGGRIVAQLWHMGRLVHSDFLDGARPVSASATTAPGTVRTYPAEDSGEIRRPYGEARPLRTDEIPGILDDYANAARNAIRAGFDVQLEKRDVIEGRAWSLHGGGSAGAGAMPSLPGLAIAAPETAAPQSPEQQNGSATQGDQAGKRAFMAQAANQRTVSAERLTAPASPNIVQAGSIIPAALITGIRSDLPGQITAQVTANVYDSPTGRILLIPQGARLIGEYDSEVAAGQTRVLLTWDRLIMPDGRSIVLERQPGADAAGYAGLQDRVNQHWGNLLTSLIHDARFRARSGHLLRLAVLRGRPASLAFVSPHSD